MPLPKPLPLDKSANPNTTTLTPAEIGRKIDKSIGKNMDISKSRGPLRDSGSALPPEKK